MKYVYRIKFKIDESTVVLDTRIFDNYNTNELLHLPDAI